MTFHPHREPDETQHTSRQQRLVRIRNTPQAADWQLIISYTDMGLAYNVYLTSTRIYGCRECRTHLSTNEDILSKNFRGQHGKAYLFDKVVNITEGEAENRSMTTGRHDVRDIFCRQCGTTVGWKYDKAYEAPEKYKEGKFILESELLVKVE